MCVFACLCVWCSPSFRSRNSFGVIWKIPRQVPESPPPEKVVILDRLKLDSAWKMGWFQKAIWLGRPMLEEQNLDFLWMCSNMLTMFIFIFIVFYCVPLLETVNRHLWWGALVAELSVLQYVAIFPTHLLNLCQSRFGWIYRIQRRFARTCHELIDSGYAQRPQKTDAISLKKQRRVKAAHVFACVCPSRS